MESDDNKRLMLALAIAMIVLFGYPYFAEKYFPAPVVAEKTKTKTKTVETATLENNSTTGLEQPSSENTELFTQDIKPKKEEKVAEVLTIVETPLYKATFSNLGGGLKSWELKNYYVSHEEGSERINLVSKARGKLPLQSSLSLGGFKENLIFTASKEKLNISEKDTGTITFTATSTGGLKTEKKYTFNGDNYTVDTNIRFLNTSSKNIKSEFVTSLISLYEGEEDYYHRGALRYINGKDEVERLDLMKEEDDDPTEESGKTKIGWLALEDKYFFQAIINTNKEVVNWRVASNSLKTATSEYGLPLTLRPNGTQESSFTAYVGPKEYDRLVSLKSGLVEAIEFGFFSWLAKPFLVALNFLQGFLKNYGLAIILLTVIIKIILHPLTKYSLKSMKQMQLINPQMVALKEKYKDDKTKMNKELMDLYKRYKVNPLSGCLPMLLQLPVFVALYEVFYVAIELRHAPFFLWINDLAAMDPYYITPVLMGISMFIHQKMTPSVMDPVQAKMMLFLPVVMTFVFLSFPAGLVLYWLVNNILSIVQQYNIHKEGLGSAGAKITAGGGGGNKGEKNKGKKKKNKEN